MKSSWTEHAVLWKTSFGFISDILTFLKICESWVWVKFDVQNSYFGGGYDDVFRIGFFELLNNDNEK